MNFKKHIKNSIISSLIVLVALVGVSSAGARMHAGGGNYLFVNLNSKFWGVFSNQANTFVKRAGGTIGYGMNIGSRGAYHGYFETGLDSSAFSSLGLTLRYGWEFMRHSPFAIGLGVNITPSYTVRANRFQQLNNSKFFMPYALELHGRFSITHAMQALLRVGQGSILFPVRRGGNNNILWPLPFMTTVELGFRYYL